MKRQFIENIWIVLTLDEKLSVYVQFDLREVHADGIVMPFLVAHFWEFPAPVARSEWIHVNTAAWLPAQKQDKSAIVDIQCIVLAIHFCSKYKTIIQLQLMDDPPSKFHNCQQSYPWSRISMALCNSQCAQSQHSNRLRFKPIPSVLQALANWLPWPNCPIQSATMTQLP